MFRQKRYLIGGGLKASTLQALLDASYSGVGNVEGFILDKKYLQKLLKYIFIQVDKLLSLTRALIILRIGLTMGCLV